MRATVYPVLDPGPTVFCPPLSMTGPCQGVATAANFTVSHYLYNQKYVSVDICRKSLLTANCVSNYLNRKENLNNALTSFFHI